MSDYIPLLLSSAAIGALVSSALTLIGQGAERKARRREMLLAESVKLALDHRKTLLETAGSQPGGPNLSTWSSFRFGLAPWWRAAWALSLTRTSKTKGQNWAGLPAWQEISCEPCRELIALELERGRNAMGIWQDLVDSHGFAGGYQSVRRFVRNLRDAATPEARVIIETRPGEEAQVDYGTGPMVRDPDSGKYRRTRLFVRERPTNPPINNE